MKLEWSDLPAFEFWMLKYFHFALEADSPIIEAIAFRPPVKKFMSRVPNLSHWRYKTKYILSRYDLPHCWWGPSFYGSDVSIWRKYGILDRADGPAIECRADISIEYALRSEGYLLGKRGSKFWLKLGKLHRLGGPAIEHKDGVKEWWVEGVLQKKRYQSGTERYFIIQPRPVTYLSSFTMTHGTQSYILHRDDGPAEISSPVIKLYHEISTGKVSKWYQYGVLHRLDGPAIVGQGSASDEWWIEGERFTRDEYRKRVASLLDNHPAKRQKIQAD